MRVQVIALIVTVCAGTLGMLCPCVLPLFCLVYLPVWCSSMSCPEVAAPRCISTLSGLVVTECVQRCHAGPPCPSPWQPESADQGTNDPTRQGYSVWYKRGWEL